MSRTRDSFWFILPVSGFFAPFALLAYFAFRIYCIVTTGQETNYHVGLAWFFVVIEFFQLVPTILLYFKASLVPKRPRRPHMLFTGSDTPGVNIMITVCGEDNNTVLNTVRAACETDWPTNRMRVIVLDDGRSEDLRNSIEVLQNTYNYVYYASRDKPEVPDYKPGNLNYGLKYADSLSDEPLPFVAGLDMDMIVKPHWLRALMPHLLKDPKLAQACPPQYYYNIPDNDCLRQDTDHYYAITELINEGLGACNCLGSGYLMRRTALDDIGGFPTFSIADDTSLSTRLTANGWRMAYVDEVLQCGKLPESLMGHIKQRSRWTVSNVQLAFKTNFRLWGPRVPNCTLRQRLGGFVSGTWSTTNAAVAWLGFLGPPLALLSGYPFIVYYDSWQLSWLLRLVSIWIFLDWINKAAFALHTAYKDGLRYDQADSWLIPYFTLTFVRSFVLPRRFGGTKLGWPAAGVMSTNIIDRRPGQSSFSTRFQILFLSGMIWFHALFILACVAGVVLNLVRCFDPTAHIPSAYGSIGYIRSGQMRWVFVLTRIGWPPVAWIGQVISCCVPISYIVWPPRAIDDNDALDLDEATGVRYPKAEYWGPKRDKFPGRISDHWTTIVLFYTVICFVGSWHIKDFREQTIL